MHHEQWAGQGYVGDWWFRDHSRFLRQHRVGHHQRSTGRRDIQWKNHGARRARERHAKVLLRRYRGLEHPERYSRDNGEWRHHAHAYWWGHLREDEFRQPLHGTY